MGTAMNLAEAVQAVAARRSPILALLNLSPKVFDSWMAAATNDAANPEGQHALLILASWIQGLPELGAARETIMLACERKNRFSEEMVRDTGFEPVTSCV